jgi:hypothetical protein
VIVVGRSFLDMNESEIKRYTKRMEVFMREGLDQEESELLAQRMYERDKERGDRRVCFECERYDDRTTHCTFYKDSKTYRPLRFVLQRCDGFKLKGSK